MSLLHVKSIKAVQPAMPELLEPPTSNKQIADEGARSPNDSPMWSDAVSRRFGIQRPKSVQQAVVVAVHVGQSLKKAREKRLVVTDLEPTASKSDVDSFAALSCAIQPAIVSIKRLSQRAAGRSSHC